MKLTRDFDHPGRTKPLLSARHPIRRLGAWLNRLFSDRVVGCLLLMLPFLICLGTCTHDFVFHPAIRERGSFAKASMRINAVAIEAYFSDYGFFPPGVPYAGPMPASIKPPYEYQAAGPEGLRVWTDFFDPFNQDKRDGPEGSADVRVEFGRDKISGRPLYYVTDGVSYYWIVSNGPDGDRDTTAVELHAAGLLLPVAFGEQVESLHFYDPTNGSASDGDIYRSGIAPPRKGN